MRFLFISLLCTFCFNFSYSENLDSLFQILGNEKTDTSKVHLLNQISDTYYNINIDSSFIYAQKANSLANKISFKKGMAYALSNMADALYYKGEYKSAIIKNQDAIILFENLKMVNELIDSYISIGQSWKELGNNPKSLDNLILALKASEKSKDNYRIGRTMISMGVLFLDQKKYSEALNYSKNALTYLYKADNKAQIANAYARIGNVFGDKTNPAYNADSVLYYYKKSLELFTEIGHQRGIAVIYNNISSIYVDQKEPEKAIEYYKKAFDMRSKLGDQNGLAIILNNLGTCYQSMKSYETAIHYLNKSLEISKKISKPDMIIDNYSNLSSCYSDKGDYKKALYYRNLYIEVKDSLFNETNTRAISDMQTKYESEKKEKEIEILNQNKILSSLKNAQQKEKLESQRYIIYGSIIVIIVVISLLFFLLRLFFQKQASNKKLKEQNIEILQQKEEIVTQRDEIEAQRDLVTKQKNEIEIIHEEVTSSIRYAHLIQDALLPSKEQLQECFSEYFLLFIPRDIVSGDFFWSTKIKNHTIFCVADCTGHGVPGGFMSMLGISFLNEIIRKDEIIHPAEILNQLREHMISSLKQKGDISGQKDGLDIALCVINNDTLEMKFSGAYNPCYVVRQNELIEIKGDRMPIAFYQRMDSFSQKEFQLKKGDYIYLFSDGFIDQFGGDSRKKFMTNKFKNTLLGICTLKATDQQKELERIYLEWKKDYNQVDDITILGIKV